MFEAAVTSVIPEKELLLPLMCGFRCDRAAPSYLCLEPAVARKAPSCPLSVLPLECLFHSGACRLLPRD